MYFIVAIRNMSEKHYERIRKTDMKKESIVDEHQNEGESQFPENTGERKTEALVRLKEIISDIGEVMVLKEENGDTDIYISVLANRNRLRGFMEQLRYYRTEDEMYLDREAAAMVSYLDDYLHDLRDFIEKHPNIPAFATGIFVDRDIQMWSDEAEKIVAGDMDAANTEIEEHSGGEWEELKSRIYDELRGKATLYHLPELPEDTAGETDAAWLEWIDDFRKQKS